MSLASFAKLEDSTAYSAPEQLGLSSRLLPFVWVGIFLLTAIVVGLGLGSGPKAAFWGLLIGSIAMLDLTTTAQVVRVCIFPDSGMSDGSAIQILGWVSAKIASLAALAGVLWISRKVPFPALISGASVLVVVPLVGSIFWSREVSPEVPLEIPNISKGPSHE